MLASTGDLAKESQERYNSAAIEENDAFHGFKSNRYHRLVGFELMIFLMAHGAT